ncbi:MAG: hypothetical protein O6766_12060 [Gammaproteobacteria bacterium]|nr:hypothetical protein [Gammaproteobacteria bacterium]
MAKAQPKLDWLNAAVKQLNADPDYRKLGSTDLTLGLAVGEECRLVVFEAFAVSAVLEIDDTDLRDADIVIRMSAKDWNAYLRNRKKGNRQKGRAPTLLALDVDKAIVTGADPLKRNKLVRYNLSIQAFLDAGAALAA